MSAADHVIATWVESTGCGTRYEELTADGQVHVDYTPPHGSRGSRATTTPTTTRSATARASLSTVT
ncbi:hypothetical protein [Streptomyces mirabilis]|uniref:hypothetical protein n=1 Tax=Streptomyces mirabilis TaxID=68239 RepID=UPI0036C48499